LTKPGAPHFLISEAVRGEGAHLVDTQGRRFAFDYHPAGELAPRDVVSRAIFSHLQQIAPNSPLVSGAEESDSEAVATLGTNTVPHELAFAQPGATAAKRDAVASKEIGGRVGHVYLDLQPIPVDKIRHRFPNIIQVCQQWGIDVFHEPIPVAPAAHYWMGGIATDLMNRTSIPGLYAVGETASTGVHGANRLASNSLLECLVFGAQLRRITPDDLQMTNDEFPIPISHFPIPHLVVKDWATQKDKIASLRVELQRLVWQSAGICRSEAVLESAIATLEVWRQEFAALPLSQHLLNLHPVETVRFDLPDADRQLRTWGETYNLLDVAHLILKSATFRTESRGGHYRLDYPQPDPNWQVHTLVQKNQWWKSPPMRA
jgi:L-aspartate oxidase